MKVSFRRQRRYKDAYLQVHDYDVPFKYSQPVFPAYQITLDICPSMYHLRNVAAKMLKLKGGLNIRPL